VFDVYVTVVVDAVVWNTLPSFCVRLFADFCPEAKNVFVRTAVNVNASKDRLL